MTQKSKKVVWRNVVLFLICIVALSSLLLSLYLYKESSTMNARVNTIVKYVRTKSPLLHDNQSINNQTEIDSLIRVLEFKSIKEDYYIDQLNMQSTWIVTFVTTLFVIFTILEYGIFVEKVAAIQQSQVKYNDENDKKLYEFSETFRDSKIQHLELHSNVLELTSATFFEKGLVAEAFRLGIMSVSSQVNIIRERRNEQYRDIVTKTCITRLTRHLEFLNKLGSDKTMKGFFIKDLNYPETVLVLNNIISINNLPITQITAEIMTKLKEVFKDDKGQSDENPKGDTTKSTK